MVSETTCYKNVSIDVNNKRFDVNFKLDTGAEVNILPLYILSMFKVNLKHSNTNRSLTIYGKFKLKPNGSLIINCSTDKLKNVPLPFWVVNAKSKPILGLGGYDIISRLEGKKIFSVVDLKDGFWHVPLDEVSSEMCTFNTPLGRNKFNKMPFGIVSAPETATAGSDVVQSDVHFFDDFFQHLWPYIGNNTVNVVFQMVKRLWLIRIDR
ncbi:transposon Tf2-9 polyprotein [Trichonephila clavipes]|nr:transposon Tf2-9 polyprotein [Trichonephila clavipes]